MFGTHNFVPKTWVLEVPHSKAFVKLCKNLAKIEENPYSICTVQKTRGCFFPYRQVATTRKHNMMMG